MLMKSAKLSSQSFFSLQNDSNFSLSFAVACAVKCIAHFLSTGSFHHTTLPKSTGPALLMYSGGTISSDFAHPRKSKSSKSISSEFPANVEKLAYGLSPYPVGPSGNTCHNV